VIQAVDQLLAMANDSTRIKDFDEQWGKGFIKPETFVGIVYESLRSEQRRTLPARR
jgi:hypothetical protein